MGSDIDLKLNSYKQIISIHAPVWGATLILTFAHVSESISIHAPVWGATDRKSHLDMNGEISIHAPVWGATLSFLTSVLAF